MNLLGLLLGASAVKRLVDYPPEIRSLRRQMPKDQREVFSREYRKLSAEAKNQFKELLKQADMRAAGSLVGYDLTQYSAAKRQQAKVPATDAQSPDEAGSDIVARVNRILAVPIDIDPALVAEAARKYEEAVPVKGMDICEKTKSGFDLSR